MNRQLLKYLTSTVQKIVEFQRIMASEQYEIEEMWQCIGDIFDAQYVQFSSEIGVKRWENILNIQSKPSDTLDERKFRILARINEQLPYTHTTLANQVQKLCANGDYSIDIDNKNYKMTVKIGITNKKNFDAVNNVLKRVVPANMIIDVKLIYNQISVLEKFTHAQLSSYTHYQLRNEVIS